jgi:dihydrofolate reductase
MAKLIYVANVSLDGYIEDAHGSFEWTAPIDEVFTFITDLVRPVGTYLYGRRMYETMAVWETQPALAAQSELMADFANVWQAADKIVYSTTLHVVSTANTRLERRFDPDSVRDLKTPPAT